MNKKGNMILTLVGFIFIIGIIIFAVNISRSVTSIDKEMLMNKCTKICESHNESYSDINKPTYGTPVCYCKNGDEINTYVM